MDNDGSGRPPFPRDLLLRILALLPPNDLALSGRLACKDAAQRFQGPQHCTACLGQPLPSYVAAVGTIDVSPSHAKLPTPTSATTAITSAPDTRLWFQTSAEEALRQLTFRQKLLLLRRAAASGCEANVEFAWQLLQPHVFPEVLQSSYCHILLQRGPQPRGPAPDVGSVAIASGLAHMLPSLAQRCPGLLDPARTLEAAATHCNLAGLQAAWDAVGQRLLEGLGTQPSERSRGFWKCMLAAAAGTSTPNALGKMEWVWEMSRGAGDPGALAHAYGAAASSGDLGRMGWLRGRGLAWRTVGALEAVVKHADLGFIQRMEAKGGYLPPAHDESWTTASVVSAAAASPRGSATKLRWLAGLGAALGQLDAVKHAAERGDLEAVQLLAGHWLADRGAPAPLPDDALSAAIASGSVPTARFLRQGGCAFSPSAFAVASTAGDLPMVRWLAEAGCPVTWETIHDAVRVWPRDTAADGQRLLEAIPVLAEAAPPVGNMGHLVPKAVEAGHPWAVLQGLLQYGGGVPWPDVLFAAAAGCEATLRAFTATDAYTESRLTLEFNWYADAAGNGDLSTLVCLQRLGLPLGEGAVGLAVSRGAPLPALMWLTEHGAPWGHGELRGKLSALAAAYPSPRDRERRDVEAWLRGLLSGGEAVAAAGGVGPAVGEQRQGQGGGGAAGYQPVAAQGATDILKRAGLAYDMGILPPIIALALTREYIRGNIWAMLAAQVAGMVWVVIAMFLGLGKDCLVKAYRESEYDVARGPLVLVLGATPTVIAATLTAELWWPHIWGTLVALMAAAVWKLISMFVVFGVDGVREASAGQPP